MLDPNNRQLFLSAPESSLRPLVLDAPEYFEGGTKAQAYNILGELVMSLHHKIHLQLDNQPTELLVQRAITGGSVPITGFQEADRLLANAADGVHVLASHFGLPVDEFDVAEKLEKDMQSAVMRNMLGRVDSQVSSREGLTDDMLRTLAAYKPSDATALTRMVDGLGSLHLQTYADFGRTVRAQNFAEAYGHVGGVDGRCATETRKGKRVLMQPPHYKQKQLLEFSFAAHKTPDAEELIEAVNRLAQDSLGITIAAEYEPGVAKNALELVRQAGARAGERVSGVESRRVATGLALSAIAVTSFVHNTPNAQAATGARLHSGVPDRKSTFVQPDTAVLLKFIDNKSKVESNVRIKELIPEQQSHAQDQAPKAQVPASASREYDSGESISNLTDKQHEMIDQLDIPGKKKRFLVNSISAIMTVYGNGAKINPAAVVAQSISESGWGRSRLTRDANNFFGIKAGTSWQGERYKISTREVINGVSVMQDAEFRKYSNLSDGVHDYASLINRHQRYDHATQNYTNTGRYIDGLLKGGYATDPVYKHTLLHIIGSYNIDAIITAGNAKPVVQDTPPILVIPFPPSTPNNELTIAQAPSELIIAEASDSASTVASGDFVNPQLSEPLPTVEQAPPEFVVPVEPINPIEKDPPVTILTPISPDVPFVPPQLDIPLEIPEPTPPEVTPPPEVPPEVPTPEPTPPIVTPPPEVPTPDPNQSGGPDIKINESASDCAPGTVSLGQQKVNDGKAELCAVLSLPSSSRESKPGDDMYVEGADGHAIIRANKSEQIVNLVTAAHKDGVDLRAVSSFRTFEHQAQLCNDDPNGCKDGNHSYVAAAGESLHGSGDAIDFDIIGASKENCTWVDNVCTAPHDEEWVWLHEHAEEYKIFQYSKEAWHFDTSNH